MLLFRDFPLMDLLQVLDQKVDLRNIEVLSYHIRRLHKPNRQNVLFNRIRKLPFGVQRVSMQSGYFCQEAFLAVLVFGKSVRLIVERPFEESFDFEGVVPLSELQDHSFIFLVANNQYDLILTNQDIFDLGKLFRVGDVKIQRIVNVNPEFIGTLFCVVLSLLEVDDDQVILFELPD